MRQTALIHSHLPIFLSIIGLFTLASCDARDAAPPPDTLVVAVQGDAQSLDPHAVTDAGSMRMIENLYSTLLRYGPTYGEVGPDLAESVTASADGRTYTVKLVPNAHFHSGRTVTAADVKYSIERIRKGGARAENFSAVESIETPDTRTAILHLSEPVAPFRTYLAYPMNAIVDREVVEQHNGDLRNADAGSGPWKLASWTPNKALVLTRHEGYHVAGLPKTSHLEYWPIADETARSTALRRGEVSMVHEVPEKDVSILDAAEGVRVESVPGTFWEYVGINTRHPPFDDARVRRAVAWAVDRDALNRAIKFGRAVPLTGGNLPPNHWCYPDLQIYPKRDVARAKALLKAAGKGGGFTAVMKVNSSVSYQVRAAEMVKQQLADVGIAVQLQGLESGVFFQQLGAGDFDLTLVGWLGFVDPDEYTYNLFHTGGKFNQQGYSNPKADQLLERGRRELDRDKRKVIYAEAEKLIAADAPMVFLYVNPQVTAMRSGVSGYVVHPTGTTIFLRDATIR